jgi:hypothetical protein
MQSRASAFQRRAWYSAAVVIIALLLFALARRSLV